MTEARNPELEAQIRDNPDDEAAYLVYADWLQQAGDPRGRLIALQAARAAGGKAAATAEAAWLEDHASTWFGPRFEIEGFEVDWYLGYWRSLHLGKRFGWSSRPATDPLVARCLATGSARFLRELVCGGALTPAVLGAIVPLGRTLERLEVAVASHAMLNDADLLTLRACTRLRRLALYSCESVSARGLEALRAMPRLASIDLRNCPLDDDGAQHLVGLPLREVWFNVVAPTFSEQGMAVLARAPLESLKLDGRRFLDDHVAPLAEHASLANLELGNAHIGAAGAFVLGSLPGLRRLYLPSSGLGDQGVRALAPLTGLRSLEISECGAGDAACRTLATFTRLRHLGLAGTRISGRGLHVLGGLTQLEQLDLSFVQLGDEDLAGLASLTNLRGLSLCEAGRLTDRAIDVLVRLPTLERIDLGGADISPRGIDRLAELPRLRQLGVEGCPQATIEHAHRLSRLHVDDEGSLELEDSWP